MCITTLKGNLGVHIRTQRQPPPPLDFSLSMNDRPKRLLVQLHHVISRRPTRNTTPPVVMKTQWIPKSVARRRLERLRRQQHSRIGCTGPTLSPPLKIDHTLKIKKIDYNTITDSPITDHADNNKTISVIPLCINFLDSFPEYKTVMYWEVKAG